MIHFFAVASWIHCISSGSDGLWFGKTFPFVAHAPQLQVARNLCHYVDAWHVCIRPICKTMSESCWELKLLTSHSPTFLLLVTVVVIYVGRCFCCLPLFLPACSRTGFIQVITISSSVLVNIFCCCTTIPLLWWCCLAAFVWNSVHASAKIVVNRDGWFLVWCIIWCRNGYCTNAWLGCFYRFVFWF